MRGNDLLLETNIVLYFLKGDDTLLTFFEGRSLQFQLLLNLIL